VSSPPVTLPAGMMIADCSARIDTGRVVSELASEQFDSAANGHVTDERSEEDT
jgi:hypothetical protein